MLISLLSNMPDFTSLGNEFAKVITTILSFIQIGSEPSDFISNFVNPSINQFTETYSYVLMIISLIIGLIICFFGYKLSTLFMTISGFIAGLFLGIFVGVRLIHGSNGIIILCALVGAILLSIFSYKIYTAGIFILCFCLAFMGLANVIPLSGSVAFFLCTLGGFIVGSLAIKFVRPVIIIVSSVVGAHLASEALIPLASKFDVPFLAQSYAPFLSFLMLLALGSLIQFLTSSEPGKKDKSKKKDK